MPAKADPAVAVVTVVAGRHDHLRAQRAFLAACRPEPVVHVVVAMDDRDAARVASGSPDLPTMLVDMATTPGGLPLAAARNAGADAAIGLGAQIVVFLDVDCLPAPELVAGYQRWLGELPDDIVCGTVTYLPPAPASGWSLPMLRQHRSAHPARPDPGPQHREIADPALFWSLSFGVRAATWRRLPGFYEGYVGYGAEDTDFARCAVAAGSRIFFVGGADSFHQHHAAGNPPLEHLDDIVRNSTTFARRHGHLPMTGWLRQFETAGLVSVRPSSVRRTDALQVATIPARHPYIDAVLPASIDRFDPNRVDGWEPDPLLDPDVLRRHAAGIDVIHLHFGYEHLTGAALNRWLEAVTTACIPLVTTIHDLRNPHQADPAPQLEKLRLLAPAAARAVTLTEGAARRYLEITGRAAQVLHHPTLLDDAPTPTARQRTVIVPLKTLRPNVAQVGELVAAVVEGAGAAGFGVRVLVHPDLRHRRADEAELHRLAAIGSIELIVAPYLPQNRLLDLFSSVHACVLPYRFGTHSGWIELCRDLGVRVVAPDCGCFAEQWPDVVGYRNNEELGLDAGSLRAAVVRACSTDRPAPADRSRRLADRDLVRAAHDGWYRALVGR